MKNITDEIMRVAAITSCVMLISGCGHYSAPICSERDIFSVSNVPVFSLDPFCTQIEKQWIGKNLKDALQGKIPDKIVILYTRAAAAPKDWLAGRIQKMWESDIILVEKAKQKHDQPMPGLSALVILKNGSVLRFELWQKCGILTSPEGYAEFDMEE